MDINSAMQFSISFRSAILAMICSVLIGVPVAHADEVDWGKVISQTNGTGVIRLEVQKWPSNGELVLPATLPRISAAYIIKGQAKEFLKWSFDESFMQVHLDIPDKGAASLPMNIMIEGADKSGQCSEGRIVFSASDARILGGYPKLKLDGVNHRISSWSDSTNEVSWDFKPTRCGMYDVELSYASEKDRGAEWQVEVAGRTLTIPVPSTGGAEKYGIVTVGRIYLEKSEPFRVRVGCKTRKGNSAVNLKTVILRPAPEGGPVIQESSGPVMLHASNAITHSVMMRYEPAEKKRCLGYWVNPTDWAEWTFELVQPGTYEVEVWQGCGKGQGGSDVQVEVNGEKLRFMVEETGHFQNFVPRQIGKIKFARSGTYSLEVWPQNKKATAVMDIRQVRLIPVEKP